MSWTPPGLGRAGVVEVPGFLCWSLRFTSCGRVVPAWGLLSLGFSPAATRGLGEEEARNQPDIKDQSQLEQSLAYPFPLKRGEHGAFAAVEVRGVGRWFPVTFSWLQFLSLTNGDITFSDNILS